MLFRSGRTYDIHHIDGNVQNNDISNLIALSVHDHYLLHVKQEDWYAAKRLAERLSRTQEEISKLASEAARKLLAEGKNMLKKWHEDHPDFRRELQKQRIASGEHSWTTDEHRENTSKRQKEKVNNNTHHLLGGVIQRRLVANGTHHLLGGEIQRKTNRKRVENRSHNFLGSHTNAKRMEDGTHQNCKIHTCPQIGRAHV